VKLLALTFLIIGNLVANQAYADDISTQPLTGVDCDKAAMAGDVNANVCVANSKEAKSPFALETAAKADVSGQPLTRLDCDKAGMSWNDNSNVCGSSQEAETMPKSEAADTLSQPLTRNECDVAGMTWNDKANVCGEKSGGSETQAASKATNPAASIVLINIDKTKQKMTVFIDGVEKYDWPVSTGRAGYSTPSGTYTPTSMDEVWYSKEWDNAPMPHSIFFIADGHAIHGSYEVRTLGKPVSHGCVRISPKNAATLYALVGKNGLKKTQIVLTGDTPGGESKVASRAGPDRTPGDKPKVASRAAHASRYAQAAPSWDGRGDQPQKRRGFFGRLFGGPNDNGPQAYYRPPAAYYPSRGY
jgi:lipoprotein-anchoring transpeptidase ErfK/SrfK